MWTRSEIKAIGKETFKRNYWKTVLVTLLVVALGGASMGSSVGAGGSSAAHDTTQEEAALTDEELGLMMQEMGGDLGTMLLDENLPKERLDVEVEAEEEAEGMLGEAENGSSRLDVFPKEATFALGGIILIVFLALLVVGMVFNVFVVNPLVAGTMRFFVANLHSPAEVKEVAYAFDHNYREVVRTMFWRDIKILLWGLLFIIPGFVKAYEYRMIPYLLAEDATMTKERAFAESKRMMDGNKWRAFVLDLSFIGWYLLSILTLGILALFYVEPYKRMTDAALYDELRYGSSAAGALPAAGQPAHYAARVPVPPFAEADGASNGDEA